MSKEKTHKNDQIRKTHNLKVDQNLGSMKKACMHAQLLSHVQLCGPMDRSLSGSPLYRGFPRQEYWSGLPFPPLGDFPHPGIEPMPPAFAGVFFTTEPPGKPIFSLHEFSPLVLPKLMLSNFRLFKTFVYLFFTFIC